LRLPAWEWAALAAIGTVMLVGKSALASVAPAGPALPPTVSHLEIDLGEQVQLAGFEFSSPALQPSQPLTVTLYWQASELLLTSFKSFCPHYRCGREANRAKRCSAGQLDASDDDLAAWRVGGRCAHAAPAIQPGWTRVAASVGRDV